MSTFPTLLGLDIAVKRKETFATLVQPGVSGKELRATFWSNPRFYYELTFNFLRQTNFSAQTVSDELSILQTFFESMNGRYGTFTFVDPVSGSNVTCRFDTDEMSIERIVNLAWKGEPLKLVSVL